MKLTSLVITAFAAVTMLLAACGGSSSRSTLPDDEVTSSDARVEWLEGILERSDTLLAPSVHVRYSFSVEGQTESDYLVEDFSCAGVRCALADGTAITVADLVDPAIAIDLTDVNLGSRGGFDTVTVSGIIDASDSIPDVTVTDTPSAFGYGFWGDHGFAAVEVADGMLSGRVDGVPVIGNVSIATAYVVGDTTGTNPTGMGGASWSGIAEAASTRTFRRREGTATVTIDDLSRPRVGVAIDVSEFDIGSPAWDDMPLTNGRYAAGTVGTDYLEGNFHGPDHSETYGVFDTGPYVGAFGAKRDQ